MRALRMRARCGTAKRSLMQNDTSASGVPSVPSSLSIRSYNDSMRRVSSQNRFSRHVLRPLLRTRQPLFEDGAAQLAHPRRRRQQPAARGRGDHRPGARGHGRTDVDTHTPSPIESGPHANAGTRRRNGPGSLHEVRRERDRWLVEHLRPAALRGQRDLVGHRRHTGHTLRDIASLQDLVAVGHRARQRDSAATRANEDVRDVDAVRLT